ncbi:MAG: hypothetical protein ACLUS6_10575 [Dysosmobacter sp.]
MPARGLFGYRNEFLTDTRGEGIMASVFDSYAPYKGETDPPQHRLPDRHARPASPITYGLFNAQERGALFIGARRAGVRRHGDGRQPPAARTSPVNVCKKKQLTNTRAAGSGRRAAAGAARQMSLEQCLEFLADDELLEVTPKSLRIRKTILDHEKRMKAAREEKLNYVNQKTGESRSLGYNEEDVTSGCGEL